MQVVAGDIIYHRFNEVDNTVDWASLVISVRSDKTKDPCPICWEAISGRPTRAPCKHSFHAECLAAWQNFAKTPSCPLC